MDDTPSSTGQSDPGGSPGGEDMPKEATKDEKTIAMLAHLSGFCGFLIPFGNIVGPLAVWLIKMNEMPFVNDQGREAVNFQISYSIYALALAGLAFVLSFVCLGFLLIPFIFGLAVVDAVLMIIAAIKAGKGVRYRYPCCVRLIK